MYDTKDVVGHFEYLEKELADQGPTERCKALNKVMSCELGLYEAQLQYDDMRAEYNKENDLPEDDVNFGEEDRKNLKEAAKIKDRIKKRLKKLKKQQKKKSGGKKKKAKK
jgi:hypothetical protein